MKKFALLLIIVASIKASAQDTLKWTADVTRELGSKAEYEHEKSIESQSECGFLFRVIGFKEFYLNGIGAYIQARMHFTMLDPGKSNVNVFEKNGVYIGTKPSKLRIYYTVDKDDRITAARITGMFSDLANLFITYWPQSADYAIATNLRPGTAAVKHCYGDLVSFKWNKGVPYITVTKDPNISFPVPPITSTK